MMFSRKRSMSGWKRVPNEAYNGKIFLGQALQGYAILSATVTSWLARDDNKSHYLFRSHNKFPAQDAPYGGKISSLQSCVKACSHQGGRLRHTNKIWMEMCQWNMHSDVTWSNTDNQAHKQEKHSTTTLPHKHATFTSASANTLSTIKNVSEVRGLWCYTIRDKRWWWCQLFRDSNIRKRHQLSPEWNYRKNWELSTISLVKYFVSEMADQLKTHSQVNISFSYTWSFWRHGPLAPRLTPGI